MSALAGGETFYGVITFQATLEMLTKRERQLLDRLLRPLEPLATGVEPRGVPMRPRAVVFDIYGTLLISTAGDVGPDAAGDSVRAMSAALADGGWPGRDGRRGVALLRQEIERDQERKRVRGNRFPEVDILAVWARVLAAMGLAVHDQEDLRITALSYECRTNPVWPMPGLRETLEYFLARDIGLGILSNAQFYTPLLLEYFLGAPCFAFGFSPELTIFSFEAGSGKPSPDLFTWMNLRLADRSIAPGQVLYVGNDMGKDIRPGREAGWHTALFAGDRRSLRLRADEPDMAGVRPDLVVDDLRQLTAG